MMNLFQDKQWIDTEVQYPGRRELTDIQTGEKKRVDVRRAAEGIVTQEGIPCYSETFNDLEYRIKRYAYEMEDIMQKCSRLLNDINRKVV
jgi:hypothetical protein